MSDVTLNERNQILPPFEMTAELPPTIFAFSFFNLFCVTESSVYVYIYIVLIFLTHI